MKIEIEYEEVEALNREIKSLKDKINELEDQVKATDINTLRYQAISLASRVFSKASERVFKELGFTEKNWGFPDVDFLKLDRHLGKSWYESNDLNVELGANIVNEFREAFLRIGIKVKNHDEKERTKLDY